jgi:hypothetical protein
MRYGQITQVFDVGVDVWDLEGRYRYPADLSQIDGQLALGDLVGFDLGADRLAYVTQRLQPSELPNHVTPLPRPNAEEPDPAFSEQ